MIYWKFFGSARGAAHYHVTPRGRWACVAGLGPCPSIYCMQRAPKKMLDTDGLSEVQMSPMSDVVEPVAPAFGVSAAEQDRSRQEAANRELSAQMDALPSPVIATSMSALSLFQRCRRAYMYEHVRRWMPRTASRPMVLGTAFHSILAAGYRAVQQYDAWYRDGNQGTWNLDDRATAFLEHAMKECAAVDKDRDGKKLGLTPEDRELLEDMTKYWFAQMGRLDLDNIEEVVSVEEPAYIQIGQYLIRNTLDLAVKYRDQDDIAIEDHKTGDPTNTKEFLALDIQTSSYYIAGRGKWGRVLQFQHTFIDREVPPGFGHRPLTTDTGKARSAATLAAMQKPEKYIQRTWTTLSDATLDAYTGELVDIIQEIDHAKATGRWMRTPIKVGPFACSHCPYFAPCQAERSGKEVGEGAAAMMYILPGTSEWNDIESGKTALELK